MTGFKTFQSRELIKERHLDTFGHVNNATYLELLEEARWEFLNAEGINLKTIHANQIGPIVLECNIKFLKELRLRQMIVIESKVLSFENKIALMSQNIMNEAGELCTEARLVFGVFDMKARKLILPPEKWLQAFGIA